MNGVSANSFEFACAIHARKSHCGRASPSSLELESAIRELEIFVEAVRITDATLRSEHLERVCGTDTELRKRIEVLLRNHEFVGSFLQRPVAAQVAVSPASAEDSTQAEPSEDMRDGVLDLLQPTNRPDALGRLGHYEVLEIVGQGGFGTVVRAFDEKLHRIVAIKIMSQRLAATSPARKRFLREARSVAAVCHENVIRIHAIEERPIPYLVMEYVAGETLQQRLDRIGPLDTVDVLRLGQQIAHGLAAAHAMGKIHRDIKPANILIEDGMDRVKITDFGLARAADDASLTQSGFIAGTPMYMAPEQAQGLALDQRADLFSLGSVLYVMCSGRPPFRAATALAVLKRVTEDTPRPIREIIPEVPEWLGDVITKLHAKKPEDRFQTAAEVADVLGKSSNELQLNGKVSLEPGVRRQESDTKRPMPSNFVPTVEASPMFPRPARSKRLWLTAAGVLLLALIGLGMTEATGVTQVGGTVIRLFSPEGTLVVEVDDPDVSVNIDGEEIVIKGAGTKEIRMKPGQYKVRASKDGKIVRQELVTVTKNGRQVVRIIREGAALAQADPDRRGAKYAMSIGGTTIILEKGKERTLWEGNAVPQEAFTLRVVSLIGNQLANDAGMDNFKGCKYLTNIDLENTNITAAKIWELKNALPWCKIEWDGDIKLLPGSVDRRAAEYVLSIGGYIAIKGGGTFRGIHARSALPQGAFDLRIVNLVLNQKVSDAELAVFKDCNRLQSLGLGGTKVSDAGLVHLKECRALVGLDLSGTQVTNAGMAHFKDHLSLTGRALNTTKITDAGLVHFKYCRKLVHLELGGTQIGDIGLAHFKDCTALARVLLPGTKVSDTGLTNFKDCNSLTRLDLTGTEVGDAGLVHVKNRKSLEQLYLGGTKVSDAGLAYFKGCEDLACLELNQTQVSDMGMAYLKDCKKLNHLDLANSRVSDALLAQLVGYPKLYTLNLKNTKVSEAGVKKLAADLPGCKIEWDGGVIEPTDNTDPDRRVAEWLQPGATVHTFAAESEIVVNSLSDLPKTPFQLRRLNVSRHTKVSDATLNIFKGLRHLTHLNIRYCKVSDAALALFKDCTQLKELQLHGTAVTDAGVAQLAGFSKLEYLNLNQTLVTERPVRTLAASLPKCRIEWDGGVIEPTVRP